MNNKLITNISVVMIVKDGQRTIEKSLEALKDFEDVVVYDNGSNDDSIKIAMQFSNVKVINGEFMGFGPTKNRAIEHALHDWILSLDCDEVLTEELVEEIRTLPLQNNKIYSIYRKNFYKDYPMNHCWGNDLLVRLFNRTVTQFNENKVHEEVIKHDITPIVLKNHFHHYPYYNISQFIQKLDHYSEEYAYQYRGIKKSGPLLAISNSVFSFLKTYLLKGAFLDGYPGLIIAFSHAATNFYKYMKLYELNRE